jgi:CRP-like cAMP-binding protein
VTARTLAEFLDASPWPALLDAHERDRAASEIVVKRLPVGACLCCEEGPPDYWYGVVDGLLKVCTTGESGESVTLIGIPAGSWFGEGTILKREPRKYDVVALRDSDVACMPAATFFRLYEESLGFNHFLITQLNERLEQFVSNYTARRTLTVEEQVAKALTWMFNVCLYPGAEPRLEISQEEIANLAGVSRPRCNQALKKLKDKGLLDVGYGAITIRDLAGLRGYAG